MMLSNLNLSSLPECNFEVRYVDSVLLNLIFGVWTGAWMRTRIP